MSIIALDYDKTWTADPILWENFAASALRRGHQVLCMTMRRPDEAIEIPIQIIYTSRRAKADYAKEIGLKIDIWIDDSPHWIFSDG